MTYVETREDGTIPNKFEDDELVVKHRLKPCPFCGEHPNVGWNASSFDIWCSDCGCKMTEYKWATIESIVHVIDRWNNRL